MEYDLDSGARSVCALHYHQILVTKYRQNTFTPERADFMRRVVEGRPSARTYSTNSRD
jgi:putative transposase